MRTGTKRQSRGLRSAIRRWTWLLIAVCRAHEVHLGPWGFPANRRCVAWTLRFSMRHWAIQSWIVHCTEGAIMQPREALGRVGEQLRRRAAEVSEVVGGQAGEAAMEVGRQ